MNKDIVNVQQCRSLDGWQPIRVASSSGDGHYTVLVNPWGEVEEYVCECRGYSYRGKCRHQQQAADKICGWSDVDRDGNLSERAQTTDQYAKRVCPQCGGPTMIVAELVNVEAE